MEQKDCSFGLAVERTHIFTISKCREACREGCPYHVSPINIGIPNRDGFTLI